MENRRFSDVIGSPSAPYETTLARECATATAYSNVGDPVHPDYVAATSGLLQAVPGSHARAGSLSTDNLFRQVRAARRTEKSYEESMTVGCQQRSSRRYSVIHNPAAYYVGAGDRAACRADDVPLGTASAGALEHDLETNTLPAFAFIAPNVCSDTHSCPVATGDQWLHLWVSLIVESAAYRSGTTAIFIVWDEYSPMPFIVISPTIAPGTIATTPFDHYALLRATEEMLGVPTLGHAATAADLRAVLHI
jgi:hypothetical protein